MMLLITGTVRLPADNLDRARPAMRAMIAASRAEDGCLDYGYAEDVIDRGLIHVRELWRDEEAFAAHLATGHLAAWRAAWPGLLLGERDLQRWSVSGSQPA